MKKIKRLSFQKDPLIKTAEECELEDKINEIIDVLNSWIFEPTLVISSQDKKHSRELVCMKCGSKKNLNTNKDKSFVECDKCMWEKEEEWKKDFYGAIGEYVDNLKDEDYLIDFIEKLLAEREEEAYKRGYLRCKMEKTNKYLKLGLSFVNVDDLSAIEYISKKEEYSVYDNSKVGKDRFTYKIHLKTGESFQVTLVGEEELEVFNHLKLFSKLLKEEK